MPRKVNVIILRAAGTNCDYETEYAFKFVGAKTDLVHINQLTRKEKALRNYQILVIPGGFTYGDDIASGKVLANELRCKLEDELLEFIDAGKLILGICNGFQVLVKARLLPALNGYGKLQEATLTFNDSGKFEDRWVYLKPVKESNCVFIKGLEENIYLPVAHGEGKFICRDENILKELSENGQIVFQYVDKDGNCAGYPWNPNGSGDNIAAICDPGGRIMGIMPHPERYVHPANHPRWTREGLKPAGDGVRIFENAVQYAAENLA